MAHTFLVALGFLLWGAALVLGAVAGYKIARLIPTGVPSGMSESGVSESGYRMGMWSLRAFIFLVMIVVVTAPVGLVLVALDSLSP